MIRPRLHRALMVLGLGAMSLGPTTLWAQDTAAECVPQGDLRQKLVPLVMEGAYDRVVALLSERMELGAFETGTFTAFLRVTFSKSHDSCMLLGRFGRNSDMTLHRFCSDTGHCGFLFLHTIPGSDGETVNQFNFADTMEGALSETTLTAKEFVVPAPETDPKAAPEEETPGLDAGGQGVSCAHHPQGSLQAELTGMLLRGDVTLATRTAQARMPFAHVDQDGIAAFWEAHVSAQGTSCDAVLTGREQTHVTVDRLCGRKGCVFLLLTTVGEAEQELIAFHFSNSFATLLRSSHLNVDAVELIGK